jgi:2-iminobutanoate/2-iminopropanoate deaminase
MKIIQTDKTPAAIGPYSQAIEANGFIFCSGQIALTPNVKFLDEDVETQTRQVLENLKNVIEAAGSAINKVVKTTIFLKSMDDFAAVNEIYAEFFGEHKPVRATIAVANLPKNAKVEIEAIALA